LPSYVKTICVDINPSTVTKLMDRGSAQAIGLVTDIGIFLPGWRRRLKGLRAGGREGEALLGKRKT